MQRAIIITALLCALTISVSGKPNEAAPKGDKSTRPESPSSVTLENNDIAAYESEHPKDNPPKWYAALERPDWWLVFVAALTGIAIAYQAREMKRATKEMQANGEQTERSIALATDTAIRQLRAYVCVSSAHIAFIQERAPEVRVHIKNSGKTPAYDVRMWIGIGHGQYPGAATLPPPPTGFQTSISILGPGEEPHALVRQYPVFPQESRPILGTPELTLFVYGKISYKDAFANERHTGYRLIFGGVERHPLRDEDGFGVAFLRADTEGNEAT